MTLSQVSCPAFVMYFDSYHLHKAFFYEKTDDIMKIVEGEKI